MADINVTMGVDGKPAVIGSFQEVGKAGKELGEALMEHTKKLAEMFLGFESLKKVVDSFKQAMDEASKLNELSDQTGIAVDKLAVLGRAFEISGQQADDMGKVVNKMQKYLVEAGDSGSEAAYHITGLGLSMAELQKLSPDQQLEAVGKAVASISDPSEKAAASMAIFGKAGGKLMELFTHFDEKVDQSKEQLGSYSEIMGMNSEELEKLGNTLEKSVGHKMTEFAVGALSNVTGGLQGLVDIVAHFNAAKFGKELTENMGAPLKAFANDIKEGNFKGAFEIAYEFVKLQALKMINELLKVGSAAAAGIKLAFATLFSQDSSFVKQAENVFTYLAHFLEKTLIEGLAGVFRAVPGMSGTADNLMQKVTGSAAKPPELKWDDMTQSQNWTGGTPAQEGLGSILSKDAANISQGWSGAWDNIEKAGKNAARAVSAAWDSVGPNNEALTEQEKKIKKLTEIQNAAKGNPTTTREGGGGGAGSGSGGGTGGATWKAKMAPIIDEASVNTGLYKNTGNMGLDMQELLAASSMGISSSMGKMYDSRIATAQRTGNFEGAASLMRERSEKTQAQQEHDLAVANGDYGGSQYRNRAEANAAYYNDQSSESKLNNLTAYYQKQGYNWWSAKQNAQNDIKNKTIPDSMNKISGPTGSGSGSGGSGSSATPRSPEAIAVAACQKVVEDIYAYMKKSLPQHALS
jgi:hypothetical protein